MVSALCREFRKIDAPAVGQSPCLWDACTEASFPTQNGLKIARFDPPKHCFRPEQYINPGVIGAAIHCVAMNPCRERHSYGDCPESSTMTAPAPRYIVSEGLSVWVARRH